MAGGAGIGAMSLMSLAIKTSGQALPPALLKGGAIIGAGIGFCISFGAAVLSLVIVLMVEQWLAPRFLESREKTLALDPLINSPSFEIPPPPKPKKRPKQTRQASPAFTWMLVLITGIILIPISKKVEWPLFATPSLDPQFKLTPSVWEGAITYKGADYTFTLVFEEVNQSGHLLGYMDWPPQAGNKARYRLVVEGTTTGNHLEFEDTEFIIGNSTEGVFDKKDVWISGNRMIGTDKNGTATLKARRTSSSPPVVSATTAVGFRAHKKAFEASWGKHMRVCQDLDHVEQGKLAPSCWKELAKEAREATFCLKTTEFRDRSACYIDMIWETGDWQGCQELGYDMQVQECLEAGVTIGGDVQTCEWYTNQDHNNPRAYSTCLAVAKRDPEACEKIPKDDSPFFYNKCWAQLAIALQQPHWCEHVPSQFQGKSSCYDLVNKRLHIKKNEFVQVSDYDRCQSLHTPIEQDACHLKLVAKGAHPTTCLRIQTETLKGTCAAIQSL
jgi:hypothetical protein